MLNVLNINLQALSPRFLAGMTVGDILTPVGDAVESFLVTIGTGLVSFVNNLMWDPTLNTGAGGLSAFAIVSLCFVGIGVSYFIIRKVFGVVRA